jgi:hypothetical protein
MNYSETFNNEISLSGPSIVDASAIVFGLVTGFIIRQMNLITPFGRIHSLVCFGILLVIGGLTWVLYSHERKTFSHK